MKTLRIIIAVILLASAVGCAHFTPATNATTFGHTSGSFGLPASIASVMPCTAVAAGGMSTPVSMSCAALLMISTQS